ncbi:hypothetical protein Drorol1_Dr00011712 [Drosera rotundifolia]
MEKPSWVLTVLTQISLCFALYLALNLGQPHFRKRFELDGEFEVYFISVRGGGGFRSVENETILLRQMEMTAKTYDVKFVASIGRLGNTDHILHKVYSGGFRGERHSFFIEAGRVASWQKLRRHCFGNQLISGLSEQSKK